MSETFAQRKDIKSTTVIITSVLDPFFFVFVLICWFVCFLSFKPPDIDCGVIISLEASSMADLHRCPVLFSLSVQSLHPRPLSHPADDGFALRVQQTSAHQIL